jgi:hypothetical protein
MKQCSPSLASALYMSNRLALDSSSIARLCRYALAKHHHHTAVGLRE